MSSPRKITDWDFRTSLPVRDKKFISRVLGGGDPQKQADLLALCTHFPEKLIERDSPLNRQELLEEVMQSPKERLPSPELTAYIILRPILKNLKTGDDKSTAYLANLLGKVSMERSGVETLHIEKPKTEREHILNYWKYRNIPLGLVRFDDLHTQTDYCSGPEDFIEKMIILANQCLLCCGLFHKESWKRGPNNRTFLAPWRTNARNTYRRIYRHNHAEAMGVKGICEEMEFNFDEYAHALKTAREEFLHIDPRLKDRINYL